MTGSNQVSNVVSSVVTPVALSGVKTPLLNQFEGAAAAYSLRRLKSWDDGSRVVRVRRESDNTERDFSSVEVSDGTMARWVNEQPTLPLDLRELDTNTGERDGALIQAAAAYSLRKLKEDFTGDVVEVRRSSDDAEESFTAAEVADGTLTDWVNTAASSLFNSAYYFAGDVHSNVNLSSDITLQDGESMSLKYFWGGTTSGVEVLFDFGGPANNALLIKTNGELRIRINGESIDFGIQLLANSIDTLTIARSGNSITTTTGYGSNSNAFVSGAFRFQRLGGTSGQSMNGVFYDLEVGSRHSYTGLGATAWEDTIGSNNGTASNLVLFAGQELDGHVKTWYDQSGSDNHATQTDPAKQPKIVEGGNLLADGVKFDGVDDGLRYDGLVLTSGTFFSTSVVTHADGTNTALGQIYGQYPGNGRWYLTATGSDEYQFFASCDVENIVQVYGSIPPDTRLLTTQGDGSNFIGFSDGLNIGSDTYDTFNPSQNVNDFTIGFDHDGTRPFDGSVAEIIIYNTDQSANRTAIEANIGETYGITAIPAANDTVNGYVQTWYDQSGEGNDAEQPTATKQPKIVDGGSAVVDRDGKPSIKGSNSMLNLPENSSFYSLDGSQSAFLVVDFSDQSSEPTTTGNNNDILHFKSFDGVNSGSRLTKLKVRVEKDTTPDGNEGKAFVSLEGASEIEIPSATTPSLQLITSTYNSGTPLHNVYIDGDFEGSSASYSAVNTQRAVFTGGSGSWIFDSAEVTDTFISEIVYYNSDQSANRTAIETNIANQYGITLS